jgi:hypothetical protein
MTSVLGTLAPPPTKLARYRILSPNAGVRVSPLQLGAMSIGDKWTGALGSMNKDSSLKLLNAFYDAGVSAELVPDARDA